MHLFLLLCTVGLIHLLYNGPLWIPLWWWWDWMFALRLYLNISFWKVFPVIWLITAVCLCLKEKWVALLSSEYPTMAYRASIKNPFGRGALINLLRQFGKVSCALWMSSTSLKEVKLYSAQVRITQCYLQITPYLPLPHKHSPDGASPDWGCWHLIAAYYSFIYPRKDERLSRPGWLTYNGRFTHISGHPSAAGQVQDRESSPVKDWRSTTVPRNQSL